MSKEENTIYRVKTDGFYGELFRPVEDKYPGKALICFSGSDGGIEMTKLLAGVFQAQGLTVLAVAYVGEEGLPENFVNVPIDTLELAAKHLHSMGYEKVGVWGISNQKAVGVSMEKHFLIRHLNRKNFQRDIYCGKVFRYGI